MNTMPIFEYVALNESNSKIKGALDAENEKDLRSKLRLQNMTLLSGKKSRIVSKKAVFSKKMTMRQKSILFRTLSSLISPQIPLAKTLELTIERTKEPFISTMLVGVLTEIKGGRSLSSSFSKYADMFPPRYIASIKAAEESDSLRYVLGRLADHSESSAENAQKIKMALAYPIILLVSSMLLIAYLLVFVLPTIVDTYSNARAALPPLTSNLLALSNWISSYWLLVAWCISGLMLGHSVLLRRSSYRRKVDFIKLKFPVIRRITKSIDSTSFLASFSMLISAGLPLPNALSVATSSVNNKVIAERLNKLKKSIEGGEPLAKEFNKTNFLSQTTIHFIDIGDRSDDLPTMLLKASEIQERDIKAQADFAISIIGVVALICVGSIVGMISYAALVPMLDLNNLF